jgi:putative CRISPR-associated protein (TIGR02619 family)
MTKHILTSVGTSLFTNYINQNNKDKQFIADYEELCNEKIKDFDELGSLIKNLSSKILKWGNGNFSSCAEFQSINKLEKENKFDSNHCIIHLLISETCESKLAADLIDKLIGGSFSKIEINKKIIQGMNINSGNDFENKALNNLYTYFQNVTDKIKKINEDGNNYNPYSDIMINITGGYKAIIPYMTLLGQLYNIPVYYIYEKSEELLEVPQLPVQFDQLIAEKYYPILSENFIPNNIKDDIKKELNDLKLIRKSNDGYEKTAMGNLFVNYVEREMPVAKSVLGFLVEMKLLEFYVKDHYLDHKKKKYQEVEHSVEDEQLANNELDLFFKKVKDNEPRGNNHFVVGEVKGLMALSDRNFDPENKNKKGLKQQFENQLNGLRYKLAFNDRKKNFQEYHLFIHIYEDSKKEPNKKNLKEMQSILKQYFPNCQFRASKVYVDINPFMEFRNGVSKVNPYSNYMHKKLTANDIKEIKNI